MKIDIIRDRFVITDFDEFEAYRVAMKIEKDGIAFYRSCRETLESDAARETIDFLILQEKEHLAFFEERLYRLRRDKEEPGEENDLLQSLDYGIFGQPFSAGSAESVSGQVEKIVRFGIGIEDRSVAFYRACAGVLRDETVRDELERIIKEEQRHKLMLEKILN